VPVFMQAAAGNRRLLVSYAFGCYNVFEVMLNGDERDSV